MEFWTPGRIFCIVGSPFVAWFIIAKITGLLYHRKNPREWRQVIIENQDWKEPVKDYIKGSELMLVPVIKLILALMIVAVIGGFITGIIGLW